ncbi:SWIM zinc finger family protein [Hazenella sp. IB182357]|uniref:SWIM zinc finger family protein n=1 Tax=Polycladospora coralii TaxID=2771432 RepID=A0A926NAY3_9BACL|nr:SWIM zinc finger family protein [Polycladospora coralii]MBD1373148.1 SWIM zinc finger family protein [Polycladospora coralii]
MQFTQMYAKSSGVRYDGNRTQIDFAPDLGREPTFFKGKIIDIIRYRDAMIALRDVVVSDLNYKPKDHSAYQEWVQEQYLTDIADILHARDAKQAAYAQQINKLQAQLKIMRQKKRKRDDGYYKAQRRYFDWLYHHDPDAWMVLDPVITVAPDQVFFEAFSLDESSYGRLAVHESQFTEVTAFQYGTTNIDFSDHLLDELQRMRSYRPTVFQIDPSGFEVATEKREVYKEKKIDVPESWVRGFLQVQSAMNLPMDTFTIQPIDMYNLCTFLRRNREKKGPRSLKYVLSPGQPVHVVIEPWDEVLSFRDSVYTGTESKEIRVWGRRRLHLMEKLLPLTQTITVHLLGNGMPSFYVLDLGSLSFTLGLSGWTRNDWADAGHFDLMIGKASPVTSTDRIAVFKALKKIKTATPSLLAHQTQLSELVVQSSLRQLCESGKVMFDIEIGKYRLRELTQEPITFKEPLPKNPRETKAEKWIQQQKATLHRSTYTDQGHLILQGNVNELHPRVKRDQNGRILEATCSCYFHNQNHLMRGPCEHILALLLLHQGEEVPS